ncbi:MAG: hypothetical protein EBX52_13770, partial [Proteobacteria bacterium]|nr:hypothetical protein [Pseudomonadota bacterium]
MQSPCFHELIESIPVIESLFDPASAGFLTRWSRHPDTAARTLRDLGRLRRIAKGSSPSIREQIRKDPDRTLEILAIEEWRLDGLTLALGL